LFSDSAHILIVEDDPSHVELILRAFERWPTHYRLETAGTLAEARNRIEESPPDLVITDMLVPDGSGIDLLRDGGFRGCPIVVMTSFGDEKRAVEAFKAGALDYVVKSDSTLGDLPHIAERSLLAWAAVLEKRGIENALLETERRFRAIFNQTFQLIGILDREGRVVEMNRTALTFAGMEEPGVVGMYLWETSWAAYSTEQRDRIRRAVEVVSGGGFERFEVGLENVGIGLRYLDFSLKPVRDESGIVILLIAEGRDITERRLAEENLRSSLREKDFLLKEIHHRVKNNLQVVASMLTLEAGKFNDGRGGMLFGSSINRILAMSRVHELLYQSQNFACVDIGEQMKTLTADLYDTYRESFCRVDIETSMEKVEIGIDRAVPFGIIANEILSNAFRHAFPPALRDRGKVTIVVAATLGGRARLEIGDDGIGLSEGVGRDGNRGIGLMLIDILVKQLAGSMSVDRDSGTRYAIEFPRE
jgi:PAS domain S-box-containing protein